VSATTTPLTLEERVANYELLLREMRAWCLYDGFGGRTAQAREYASTIEQALAGEDTHILARHNLLEAVAATAHQLSSEHGYPDLLRGLAETMEALRGALDGGGYTEWDAIGGIKE
jgi:hypothetical protein